MFSAAALARYALTGLAFSTLALASPAANAQWQFVDSLNTARDQFAMVRLKDGKVLAAGGHQQGHIYATGNGGGSGSINTITRFDCTTTQIRFRNVANTIIATISLAGSSSPTLVCSNSIVNQPINRLERIDVGIGVYNKMGFYAGTTQVGTITFNGAVSALYDTHSTSNPIFNRVATGTQSGAISFMYGNTPAFEVSLMPSPYAASLASAELYNPATNQWNNTGSMITARKDHTLTKLNDGSVLAIGGVASDGTYPASVERYVPVSGSWTQVAPLPVPGRFAHTATLLLDGRVLVVGGQPYSAPTATDALIYNPTTNVWTMAESTAESHSFHTATLLHDGRVLVFGHENQSSYDTVGEVFVPVTGKWQTVFTLPRRKSLSATLLHDGQVLLAGGYSPEMQPTYNYAESWLFDPKKVCSVGMPGTGGKLGKAVNTGVVSSAAWDASSVTTSLREVARIVSYGEALAVKSTSVTTQTTSPTTASQVASKIRVPPKPVPHTCPGNPPIPITQTGSMTVGRSFHGAGLRPDGLVLIVGGNTNSQSSYSTETYDPKTGVWSVWSNNFMNTGRLRFGHAMLDDGEMLVAGGKNALALASAEKLTPLPNGQDCLGDLACSGRMCVDGVCCNDTCEGDCEGCFTSAATKGVCSPRPNGFIPVSETGPACSPYRCDGSSRECPTSCSSTYNTCYPTAICDANNECGINDGAPCDQSFECTSNYCVDRKCATPPTTPYRVVYLPGRTSSWWDSIAFLGQPDPATTQSDTWKHIQPVYNNYQKLFDNLSGIPQNGTQAKVRDSLLNNCVLPNQCVVMCYSTGCARYLLALHDISQQSYPNPTELDGLLWVEAAASVAGGTELAGNFTKWWQKLIKKIMCKYIGVSIGGIKLKYSECKDQPIDDDLTVSHMRGFMGYIQNGSPVSMFHLAGGQDMKLKIWFFKFSLNDYFPGDKGDGVVPVHSAGGYAQSAAYNSLCTGAAKYTNRSYEQCGIFNQNHYGMFVKGVEHGSIRLLGTQVTLPYAEEAPVVSSDLANADPTFDDVDLADSDNPTHTGACNGACCFDTSIGVDVCQ